MSAHLNTVARVSLLVALGSILVLSSWSGAQSHLSPEVANQSLAPHSGVSVGTTVPAIQGGADSGKGTSHLSLVGAPDNMEKGGSSDSDSIAPHIEAGSLSLGPGSVENTICVGNGDLYTGNYVCPPNGNYPLSVALGSDSGELYVSQGELNAVQILDTSTGNVLKTIGVGDFPDAMIYDPADEEIYVANYDSNNVTVINDITHSIVANVSVGSTPYALALDTANGEVFVANTLSNNVSVICGDSSGCGTENTVIANIHVGIYPEGVAFDATTDDIYVSNDGTQNVSVICAFSSSCGAKFDKVIANPGVGGWPEGVTWDSASDNVYVVNDENMNVSVIDPIINQVVANFGVGIYPTFAAFDPSNDEMYIGNGGENNVTVVCGVSSGCSGIPEYHSLANVTVGDNPRCLAYDAGLSSIFVANGQNGNISVIGPANTVTATFQTGAGPNGLSFDPSTGTLYVANETGGNDVIFNASSYAVSGIDPAGPGAADTAYDPTNGLVYTANGFSGNVSAVCGDPTLCGSSTAPVATVNVGDGPEMLAFDTLNGEMYVTDINSGQLSIICAEPKGCGAMNTVVDTIDVGAGTAPLGVAFDPDDGDIYVAAWNFGDVDIVCGESTGCGTMNTVIASINLVDDPQYVAFDPADGEIYVTGGYQGSNVTAICGEPTGCGAENTVVANIPIGLEAEGVAYDPANGYLYADSYENSNVNAICGNTTACGTLNVVDKNIYLEPSYYPGPIAYDPESQQVLVTSYASGAESIIGPPTYLVDVNEVGLPAGKEWNVTLDGSKESSITTFVGFSETNGTYAFSVSPVTGYKVNPESGNVTVKGSSVQVNLTFTSTHLASRYSVTFNEVGLPAGTLWYTIFNGSTGGRSTSSITWSQYLNGTYAYSIEEVSGYTVSPEYGNVTIKGANQTVSVAFTAIPPKGLYTVTFTESGLASGTLWNVTFNGTKQSATLTDIVFANMTNGTYDFSVAKVGTLAPDPASGTVKVSGAAASQSIKFSSGAPPPATYSVTLAEKGLPTGTTWGVTFNGDARTGTNASWVVSGLANGSYAFKVANVSGYTVSPTSGTLTVDGKNTTQTFTFTASSTSSTSSNGSNTILYVALAVVVVAVVGVVALLLMKRKRGPKAPLPQSQPAPTAQPTTAPPPQAAPPAGAPMPNSPPVNLPPPPPPTMPPPPPS